MIVHTSVGGSVMVLQLSQNYEHYIDAQHDTRHPNHVHLELVQQGRVRRRMLISKHNAPEKIIDWIKEWLQ